MNLAPQHDGSVGVPQIVEAGSFDPDRGYPPKSLQHLLIALQKEPLAKAQANIAKLPDLIW